jgi:hypothetical protein
MLICAFTMGVLAAPIPSGAATSESPGGGPTGSLQEETGAIFAAIEASEYEIGWQPAAWAYMAPNRAQNLRFTFHEDGVTVVPREPSASVDWSANIRLASYGRAGARMGLAIGSASWMVSSNAAQVRSDSTTIEYKNDREGLRQNFLVAQRPLGAGPLRLDFTVERDRVQMFVDKTGEFMYFVGGQTRTEVTMRYKDLKVFDANQRTLAARMELVDEDRFAIVVDDTGASYPVLIDPLYGDGSLTSPSPGSKFGFCVAYIMTFDPFGSLAPPNPRGGLLVGAPAFDPGSVPGAGKVFLYDTGGGSLPTSPTWSYVGTQAGEALGMSVADGGKKVFTGGSSTCHIILVGAPWYDSSYTNEGAVLAFYPDSSGHHGSTPNWMATGGATGAHFGYSIAAGTDFNSDGWPDLLVGAPNYSSPASPTSSPTSPTANQVSPCPFGLLNPIGNGEAVIFYGTATGFGASPGWSAEGTASSLFGFSVAWGNVDSSGHSAVIVGAPTANPTGAAYEFLNGGSGPDWSPDATLLGPNGGLFGYALACADQDGDGFADLVVGAPTATYNSLSLAGMVYLYRGSIAGLSATPVWTSGGTQAGEGFGFSLALGDMDGDGYRDLIIGAPCHSDTSLNLTQNGAVYLYLTDPSPPHFPNFSTWRNDGLRSNVELGTSVAYGANLVNHHRDMIASGPYDALCPNVQVWYWQ